MSARTQAAVSLVTTASLSIQTLFLRSIQGSVLSLLLPEPVAEAAGDLGTHPVGALELALVPALACWVEPPLSVSGTLSLQC